MQLTSHFSLAELTVTNKPLPNVPSERQIESLRALAVNVLQPLRDALGKPITVTSGFRSPRVNAAVGGASTSQHLQGEAADIKVEGVAPLEVARTIVRLDLPFDQVINEFNSWVHVSYGPRHRREQKTAVKRGASTAYLSGLR